jgi:chromosomal replication initiator protein
VAACEFNKKLPTLKFVQQTLSEIISSGKKKGIQPQDVIAAISQYFNIPVKELIEKGRKKEIAYARHLAMYLMRSELNTSYPSIGIQFGGRDHTTALHAFEKIAKDIENDDKVKEDVAILKDRLYAI